MKKFFQDMSWAQIFAGALAAVTSFLLSSKIGIAGSVIGVAIGSIVSAVASQLYKNVFDVSTQKIQETVIGPNGEEEEVEEDESEADPDTDSDSASSSVAGDSQATQTLSSSSLAALSQAGTVKQTATDDNTSTQLLPGLSDATTVLPAAGKAAGQGSHSERSVSSSGASSSKAGHKAGVGQTSKGVLYRSQVERKKRMVIVVSVVSALVAVLISALIINTLTRGEGTDHVVRDIVRPSQSVQTPAPSDSGDDSDSVPSQTQTQRGTPSSTPSSASPSSSSSSPSPSQTQKDDKQQPTVTPSQESKSPTSPTPSPSATSPSSSATPTAPSPEPKVND